MVQVNKSFLKSASGILRSIQLLTLLGVIISSSIGTKSRLEESDIIDIGYIELDQEPTRSALLAFSIIGFCISLLFLSLNVFNGIDSEPFKNYPVLLIVTHFDVLISLGILGSSIDAAIVESKLKKPNKRRGAYASAAGFGFASFILYLLIIFKAIIDLKSKSEKNPRVQNQTSERSEPNQQI